MDSLGVIRRRRFHSYDDDDSWRESQTSISSDADEETESRQMNEMRYKAHCTVNFYVLYRNEQEYTVLYKA